MAEYLIQDKTLSAIADKIREKLDEELYTFHPSVLAGYDVEGWDVLVNGSVTTYYTKFIDSGQGYEDQEGDAEQFNFVTCGYLENNTGKSVPVLLDDYELSLADRFYYEGTESIDGITYDKWRKIDGSLYSWDGSEKCYKYTNVIINSNIIFPDEMPGSVEEVYNKGYSNAQKTFNPTLYGTYILKENPVYESPSENLEVDFDLSPLGDNAFTFAYFCDEDYEEGEYRRDAVSRMVANKNNFIIYNIDQQCLLVAENGHWVTYWQGESTVAVYPDDRYRIVEFTQPLMVQQKFYDTFISLVDNASETPYDIGFGVGHEQGYDDGVAITNDANATASSMLKGYSAYVDGEKIEGTMLIIDKLQKYNCDIYDSSEIYDSTENNCIFLECVPEEDGYLPPEECQIQLSTPYTNFGNATIADVAAGKTFTSAAGFKVTGTAVIGAASANIIKAGTYVFKDTLDFSTIPIDYDNCLHGIYFTTDNVSFNSVSISASSADLFAFVNGERGSILYNGIWGTWSSAAYKTITVVQDIVVSPLFYSWFNLNLDNISFRIYDMYGNSTVYSATRGMTWEQWVSSQYNTGGYYIQSGSNIVYGAEGRAIKNVDGTGMAETGGTSIIDGGRYMTN